MHDVVVSRLSIECQKREHKQQGKLIRSWAKIKPEFT